MSQSTLGTTRASIPGRLAAGLVEVFLGVEASRTSLEEVARPVTAHQGSV